MARRNIFDRDTGAGYYSDALGNFLENIPSLYGQLAKEKRIEKQRIEDTNYRNQTYNNQLLQQSRNNKRLAENDQITKAQFEEKVKNNNFKRDLELANILEERGNYNAVDKVLIKYGKINQEDINNNNITVSSLDTIQADMPTYRKYSLNEQFENFHSISDSLQELNKLYNRQRNPNSTKSRTIKKYIDELKLMTDFASDNSGKNIELKNWNSETQQRNYNNLDTALKDNQKRVRDLNSQIRQYESNTNENMDNLIKPIKADRNALMNEIIPSQVREMALLESNNKYPSIPKKKETISDELIVEKTSEDKAVDSVITERQKFIDENELLILNSPETAGVLIDYLESPTDFSFSFLKDAVNLQSSQINADAPQIVGVVPPESTDFVGIEPIPGTKPQVTEPLLAEGGEPEPKPEPKPKPNIPPILPIVSAGTLSGVAKEQEELYSKESPESLDKIFEGAETVSQQEDRLKSEADKLKSEAAKYSIEPLTDASRKDDKVVAQKKRKVSNYITRNLEGDLIRLNNLNSRINDYKGQDNQTSRYNLKKLSESIKEIEDRIKNTIGEYINPISGDISIADEGYKKSVIKRLNKKFGKDVYPILASLSSVQRI